MTKRKQVQTDDDVLIDTAIKEARAYSAAREEQEKADALYEEKSREMKDEQFKMRINNKKDTVEKLAAELDKEFTEDVKKSLETKLEELEKLKSEYASYQKTLVSKDIITKRYEERKEELLKELLNFKKMIIQLYAQKNKFFTMNEADKLSYINENEEYASLCKDLPVVTRYIILDKQFSINGFRNLFRRMINPPEIPKNMDKKEAQHYYWCDINARYVSDLFAEIHRGKHASPKEKKFYYESTYNQLVKDFAKVKDQYSEKEIEIAQRKREIAGKNAKNVLAALVERYDEFEDDIKNVSTQLYDRIPRVAYNKVMVQLLSIIERYEGSSRETMGKGNPYASKQRVQINAYVDDEQVAAIAENETTSKYVDIVPDEYEMIDEESYIE